jgi:hypothetical protein
MPKKKAKNFIQFTLTVPKDEWEPFRDLFDQRFFSHVKAVRVALKSFVVTQPGYPFKKKYENVP